MQGVSPEDEEAIKHINYVSNEVHDFADILYESLMDREYDEAKDQAQSLIKVLADLIQSLSDEI
jgi:hypothetical protein|tara:strand:- start:8408 stop:8599 length:192 start_codon:yes stop_codon:yes gene_type:complete